MREQVARFCTPFASTAGMRKMLLLIIVAATGCASAYDYIYQPAANATGQANGYPAADYAIPPSAPRGNVRIASFGVTEVKAANAPSPVRTLHLRMIASNAGDPTPWTIDTNNVTISIPNEGQSGPAFMNSDAGNQAAVNIPLGQTRTIDFYYPLPAGMQDPSKVPAFAVRWQVQAGPLLVAQTTPFERTQLPIDYYGDYYVGLGVGVGLGYYPYWWWDPFYPRVAFYHPGFVARPYYGRPVYVAQPHGWRHVY